MGKNYSILCSREKNRFSSSYTDNFAIYTTSKSKSWIIFLKYIIHSIATVIVCDGYWIIRNLIESCCFLCQKKIMFWKIKEAKKQLQVFLLFLFKLSIKMPVSMLETPFLTTANVIINYIFWQRYGFLCLLRRVWHHLRFSLDMFFCVLFGRIINFKQSL